MIVFVGLLIVAILAGGLLVSTGNTLQATAEDTGEDSLSGVSDRVTVIDQYVNRSAVKIDQVELSNDEIEFTNASYTVRVGTDDINQKSSTFDTVVSSGGSVRLGNGSETLRVKDGGEVQLVNRSGGGWTLVNETAARISIDGTTVSVLDDGDGTAGETLTVGTQAGETVSLTEGTVDEAQLIDKSQVMSVGHRQTATASVTGSGSVTVSSWGFSGSLVVYDGDTLRVSRTSNDAVQLLNLNTSGTVQSSRPFLLANDTDGVVDEQLTLTNATGTSVRIDEDSDGETGSTGDENYELDTRFQETYLIADDGELVPATVPSGGNVTVTDGSSNLTVRDDDSLRLEKTGTDEITITNVNTSTSLTTTAADLEVVDDGDGTSGEELRFTNGSLVVNSSESTNRKFRVRFGTKPSSQTATTVTLTVMRGAGARDLDLSDATIQVVGSRDDILTYSGSPAAVPNEEFGVETPKDVGGTAPVLSSDGDRFNIVVQLDVPANESFTLLVTMQSGAVVRVEVDPDNMYRITGFRDPRGEGGAPGFRRRARRP